MMPPWALATPIGLERFREASSIGFSAAWDFLSPKLARAQADADWWFYVANNPEQARAEHQAQIAGILAQMDDARAQARSDVERRVLDRLERTDPMEYRRLAWLRLTDRAAFRAVLDTHLGA
ncbi:hypothetical protein SK224_00280 [Microbacterium sp. BG28]|uniref:hypothetical protein n=1 Tax=Microbacterium sp. BG28 TaxID=3097356 RepID=UPI002A5A0CD4|nr:hypothetical protein [Microbacterium sp. BG28]MDY0827556.1 hypothetical protein [Microbacterium sp. BG28]